MKPLNQFVNEVLQVPIPIDCSNKSVDSIVSGIHSVVSCNRDDGNTRNDVFYAGICKDVKDNMQRHGNDHYVAFVDCGTRVDFRKKMLEFPKSMLRNQFRRYLLIRDVLL